MTGARMDIKAIMSGVIVFCILVLLAFMVEGGITYITLIIRYMPSIQERQLSALSDQQTVRTKQDRLDIEQN